MIVEIAISTYEDRIMNVTKVLLSPVDDVKYLIIHQTKNPNYNNSFYYRNIIKNRNDIRIVTLNQYGLANSRNAVIKNYLGDIIIPTDDDVKFLPESIELVKIAHKDHDADIITFIALDESGRPRRKYPTTIKKHNLRSIFSLSSIEITIKSVAFVKSKIEWDCNFGLNQRYRGGLENAFMANAMKKKLKSIFIPQPIVVHPNDGTGFNFDLISADMRGAILKKIYGKASYFLIIFFVCKNINNINNPLEYISHMFSAAINYRRS